MKRFPIRWLNAGKDSGDSGYWESNEGRFEICPVFWGRVRPTGYQVSDNFNTTKKMATKNCSTVREAKATAQRYLNAQP